MGYVYQRVTRKSVLLKDVTENLVQDFKGQKV